MARSRRLDEFECVPKRIKLHTDSTDENDRLEWTFDMLPIPAQNRIMRYIANGYRQKREWNTLELMLVSKTWHQEIVLRIKHVYVHRNEHTEKLNRFSNANILHVCTSRIDDRINLAAYPKITKICFHDVHPYKVSSLYENSVHITGITWSGSQTSGKCLHAFYNWIINNSRLQSLELIGKYGYCDVCYSDYAEMTSLTHFTLKHSNNISLGIIQNICSLPNIRKIELVSVEFKPEIRNWQELFDVFDACSNLEQVTLSRNLVLSDEASLEELFNERVYGPPELRRANIHWVP